MIGSNIVVGYNLKMTMKHLILGLTIGIAISFISWIVGMILNSIFVKTEYYKKLSNLNFIESKSLNESIGIENFKRIVKNTFLNFLIRKLSLKIKMSI